MLHLDCKFQKRASVLLRAVSVSSGDPGMCSQMDNCLGTALQGAGPQDPVIHSLSGCVLRASVCQAKSGLGMTG